MIERAAEQLAALVVEGGAAPAELRSMFGTVIAIATGTATIRPDLDEAGEMGPLPVVCGKAKVADRVLCLYLPNNELWVVIAR